MPFKKFQMNETANQIKYWQIEVVNFTIGQWNHFCRIMILHSKHNEEKTITAENLRCINTWLQFHNMYIYTYIYIYIYIVKLEDIVNKYSNTYLSIIKMKTCEVKSSTDIDSSKEINDKNSSLKLVM